MARHYACYTDDDIKRYAAEVFSLSALLRKLGLKATGGNFVNMKRKLQKLQIDCSHWKKQGWNKGEQLKDWSQYTKSVHFKPHLIKLRGLKCEMCNLSTWLDYPITIEIHHIDGDRTNNTLENLQLLCPNCHSLTNNWRGRKSPAGETRTLKPITDIGS